MQTDEITIREISTEDVWQWLALGWRDFQRAPAQGLFYGISLAVLSMAISYAVVATGEFHLLPPLLAGFVLIAPFFGIADPRTSERISFVGGIRGPGELEQLVDRGEYACAFSLFPTSIEDLMVIADEGGIMPPKSTWFEPKLRDAMFCHLLGSGGNE